MGVVGATFGGLFGVLVSPTVGPLVGWDAAALSWLILLWRRLWRLDADATARLAVHEDPNRAMRDALLLAACVASLLAVGVVLTTAHAVGAGPPLDAYGGLGVLSVVLSWFVVHTLFTARYARLYYGGEPGGVNFHQDERPCYADFAYLSFTIGMTFQVSDTILTTDAIRYAALRQALLSYVLGAIVLATAINLIAGLVR